MRWSQEGGALSPSQFPHVAEIARETDAAAASLVRRHLTHGQAGKTYFDSRGVARVKELKKLLGVKS